jgi:hypothetical protein
MARAFGATAGAASTDIISLPCANGLASTRTISFHGFRNGTGDNDLGRYFDRQGATLCYLDGGSSALWIEDALTPTSGAYFLSFPTDAAWTVITIVHTVGSTPAVYYNGVSQSVVVSQAASGTPTGITTPFDIGNRTSPSSNRPLGGAVAEFGVWDRLLDANEVAALGGGMSPGCIPTNLVVYAPLIRDVVDLRGQGSAPTVSGTAVYPHPRVFEAPESAVLVPITATVTSVSGSLATTEPPDTSALAVTIANQATLASTDRPDAAALNATVANQAQLATTEPPDATAAAVTVANLVQLAATEAPDVAAISAAPITAAAGRDRAAGCGGAQRSACAAWLIRCHGGAGHIELCGDGRQSGRARHDGSAGRCRYCRDRRVRSVCCAGHDGSARHRGPGGQLQPSGGAGNNGGAGRRGRCGKAERLWPTSLDRPARCGLNLGSLHVSANRSPGDN